jgi:flagellar hook-associated protein 1 FlgK
VPVSINAGTNDTLNLKVDGATVPPITLNPNDQTASDVTSDINTQLTAAGVNATASVDSSGKLVITSGSTTSNASVQVLSGDANSTLGLSVGGPPNVRLMDSYGNNVTSEATTGSLAAAVQQQNQVLPAIQGDFSQTGSLNEMAKSFADRVNSVLGLPLFTYDQTNSTNIAASLQVNPNITSSQLPSPQVVSLTGSSVSSPLAITAGTNDKLNFSVDGGATQTVTLSPSDTTMTQVAADLNTQFATLGIGAQVSVDAGTGALKLATTNTGTSGSIQILSGTANATIGLTSPTATYQDNTNNIALNLASMSNPTSSANEINGQSYTAFFGSIGSNVGTQLSAAQTNQTSQQDVVTQAQSLRQQMSGVDLNEEATRVLELQSSYQAASKMITVIDNLTQSVLAIIPQT